MLSAFTQVVFVLLQRPSSPFSQGGSNPGMGHPSLQPLGTGLTSLC